MQHRKPHIRIVGQDKTILRIIPQLAHEIGFNESIVLLQLAYWIRISDHYIDDNWWAYKSAYEMRAEAFPWWSPRTIDRTLHSLHQKGLIQISDKHNKRAYDRTRWFALNRDGLHNLVSIRIIFTDAAGHEITRHDDESMRQTDANSRQDDARSSQDDATLRQDDAPIPETIETTQESKDLSISNDIDSRKRDDGGDVTGDPPATLSVPAEDKIIAWKRETGEGLNQQQYAALLATKTALMQAVAHTFQTNVSFGGFNAALRAQLIGISAKGKRAQFRIDDPPMRASEIIGFGLWTKRVYERTTPGNSAEILYERVREFRSHALYAQACLRGEQILADIMDITFQPLDEVQEFVDVNDQISDVLSTILVTHQQTEHRFKDRRDRIRLAEIEALMRDIEKHTPNKGDLENHVQYQALKRERQAILDQRTQRGGHDSD